jgi:hypothetical protein
MDQVTRFFRHALVGVRYGARNSVYQICYPNPFLWRLFFRSLSADFKG